MRVALVNLLIFIQSAYLHCGNQTLRNFRTTHFEDRLGGLFSYMPTTESITTPHVHTRAVSRRSIN